MAPISTRQVGVFGEEPEKEAPMMRHRRVNAKEEEPRRGRYNEEAPRNLKSNDVR